MYGGIIKRNTDNYTAITCITTTANYIITTIIIIYFTMPKSTQNMNPSFKLSPLLTWRIAVALGYMICLEYEKRNHSVAAIFWSLLFPNTLFFFSLLCFFLFCIYHDTGKAKCYRDVLSVVNLHGSFQCNTDEHDVPSLQSSPTSCNTTLIYHKDAPILVVYDAKARQKQMNFIFYFRSQHYLLVLHNNSWLFITLLLLCFITMRLVLPVTYPFGLMILLTYYRHDIPIKPRKCGFVSWLMCTAVKSSELMIVQCMAINLVLVKSTRKQIDIITIEISI